MELVVKGKDHSTTGQEGPVEEYVYSFTLSLTSALDGGRWSTRSLGYHGPVELVVIHNDAAADVNR